jgi:hypothetical protein
MTWASDVVDRLIELRAAEGPDFDRHWALAMRLHPARGRDMGEVAPRLIEGDNKPADSPMVSFFRRVCEAAYNDVHGPAGSGNGPAIRYFTVEMVRAVDDSGPARRARGHLRQVA